MAADNSSTNYKFIRLLWCDMAGQIRGRIFPAHFLKERTCKIAQAQSGLGAHDIPAPGTSLVGEDIYTPDWSSLRPCPYLKEPTATCMGFFIDKDPAKPQTQPRCPRTVLKNAIDLAERTLGRSFFVGFELEFVLLNGPNSVEPLDDAKGWCSMAKLRTGSKALEVLHEIYDAFLEMGIQVQTFHAEAAPGQLEFPLPHLPPLEAVDQMIAAREAIFNIAFKHGLRATFAPAVSAKALGSGLHTHISMTRKPGDKPAGQGGNIVEELTLQEHQLIAGIVDALPSLVGITMPSSASYSRMGDHMMTGGAYAFFGIEHRDAPLRVCWAKDASGTLSHNFEMRQHDATSNPYLATAALIHAGLLGIEDKLPLPPRADKSVSDMSAEERQEQGFLKCQPTSIEEALDKLESNRRLVERIGKEAIEAHLTVRRYDASIWRELTEAEQRQFILRYY